MTDKKLTPSQYVRGSSDWHKNPDADETLRALYKDGLSNSVIAGVLNKKFGTAFTRSAVIGRATRLGITHAKPGNRAKKPQRPRTKRERVTFGTPKSTEAVAPAPFIVRTDIPPPEARKSLVELREMDCRWPVGDPLSKGFGFCAQERVPGKPYCPDCCQRAYQPIPVRTREREREPA
ncbi:MAG: GcrA family cell cycle regulator [Betaproteobacteria bacterium]